MVTDTHSWLKLQLIYNEDFVKNEAIVAVD